MFSRYLQRFVGNLKGRDGLTLIGIGMRDNAQGPGNAVGIFWLRACATPASPSSAAVSGKPAPTRH